MTFHSNCHPTEDNSNSLMKTEEFLEFVDELSQEPSLLSDKEGTSNQDATVLLLRLKNVFIQLMLLITLLRMLTAHLKAKIFLLFKCLKIMELSL